MKLRILLFLVLRLWVCLFIMSFQAVPHVIYGEDNRKEVSAVDDQRLRKSSKSVALLARTSALQPAGAGYRLRYRSLQEEYGVCKEERFAEQPAVGHCSSFLVRDDIIVSAGHCLYSAHCKDTAVIFDYNSSQDKFPYFERDKVYFCQQVLRYRINSHTGEDYAVMRLDRPVRGRTPLQLQTNSDLERGDRLYVIGHPLGLPLKISDQAYVRRNSRSKYFITNTDTYDVSSGSPVFNAETHLVEGVLARGNSDFQRHNGCQRSRVCKDKDCDGEDVVRSSVFAKYIL